jgi:tetratricopeptide (TPR) repeat protein
MKKALITTAVFLALSGCGSTSKGTKEFDLANQLATAQQYSEAIAYMEQALAQNPKNATYTAKLAELRQTYLSQTMSQVQTLLAGDVTKAKLDKAESLLDSIKKAGVTDVQLDNANSLLTSKRSALYKELEQQYSQAKMQMEQQDWVSAHATLKKIAARFGNYEDVQIRIKTTESQAVRTYLKAANTAIKQDEFGKARMALKNLLAVVPKNPIANSLLMRIKKNDNAAYFISKAQLAFQGKEWQQVIDYCRRAASYGVLDDNSQGLLAKAKEEQSAQVSAAVLESMSEGRLLEAARQYGALKELNVIDPSQLTKIREALAQQAAYSAGTYKQNDKYAMAWNLYRMISQIDPAYPQLFNEIRAVEDAISDRSRRQIAVFDFNSPAESNDAGVIVANNLISRLFNNAGNDVSILERENLKSILEEMKLGQIGVVSESTAKEMGRVYGIDFAIMGSVLLYKVDENTSESTKTIRYQVGEKIEDNIDYLNWKAVNLKPSKKELQDAPQAKIMVPEYGEKEYQVIQTKKVGFLQLSFRIVDVLTGENTRVDTIERKVQVDDTSNAGVQDAGIKYDAMEVPTDTEILQQLTEEIVEHMAAEVLRPLQQLETFYFNQGKDRERRSELEQAVEYYTYAVFNEKLKSISSSPVTVEAQKRIEDILSRYRFSVN